ncbi:MAG: hypothetical protein R2845_10895 [Thermomicrobiales bacterium]
MTDLPAIKIAHIKPTPILDTGLAKIDPESNRNQRAVDVEHAYERAITGMLEAEPDLIVHSGDVFHQTRPTTRCAPSSDRRGASLQRVSRWSSSPGITTRLGYEPMGTVYLCSRTGATRNRVHYRIRGRNRRFDALRSRSSACRTARCRSIPTIRSRPPCSGWRNILLLHGMVPGMADIAHYEPGTQEISANLRPSIDIALGHYHVHSAQRHNALVRRFDRAFRWG